MCIVREWFICFTFPAQQLQLPNYIMSIPITIPMGKMRISKSHSRCGLVFCIYEQSRMYAICTMLGVKRLEGLTKVGCSSLLELVISLRPWHYTHGYLYQLLGMGMLSFVPHRIIQLDDSGMRGWTTCPESLHEAEWPTVEPTSRWSICIKTLDILRQAHRV